MQEKEIKEFVKDRYSKIATKEEPYCSCCSKEDSIIEQAKAMGYTMEDIKSIPEDAVFGLGCGNPTALAELKEGETVLDLGSGGGIDVFLAANKVGNSGKVIGVDMTEEMVKNAIKNAEEGKYKNVEFKLGEIENLPVEDGSIDVIISNCVINLTPDKLVAYKEAFRVLKPGGRILVSDLVTEGEIPEDIKRSFQAWSECIAGAMEKQAYLDTIKEAGFNNIEIVEQHYFTEPDMDERLIGKIKSIQVKASKYRNKTNLFDKRSNIMENNKCNCGFEDTERVDESIKDNSNETKGDKLNEDNSGCGCSPKYMNEPEEDAGCGCGSTEYSDQSLIDNPDKPKFIAEDEFINEFESYAHSLGIKSIGYTQLAPELLIKDKFIQYPHAIVLIMEMDKEIIETAPGAEAQKLNDSAYAKLGKITYQLSDYLREKGYATEVAHPYGGVVNFSPLAQKAGLGWIGKSGLLITPELGPRQKISAIFTSIANLPMKGKNEHSWIPGYCDKCSKCVKACPEKALVQKETCCGDKEIEFVQKLCIGCSQGCTYCIEECPFDKKGYDHIKNRFDKMNAKLREKGKNKCC